MNLKKTLLLALVALAIGAYIRYSELPRLEEKSNAELLLGGMKRDDVEKIDLAGKRGTFSLVRIAAPVGDKKDEPRWALGKVDGPDLDKGAITALLTALGDAKSDTTISKDEIEKDLSVYGLSDPELKISAASGQRSSEIQLGKLSSYSRKRYAKVTGRDELYLISDSLFLAANKPQDDFRDRNPIKFADADLSSIVISTPKGQVTLTQKESKWSVTAPIAADANDPQIAELLRNLRYLRADKFYSKDAEPGDETGKKFKAADFGLKSPPQRYVLNFREELKRPPLTVLVGEPVAVGTEAPAEDADEGEGSKSPTLKRSCFTIDGRGEIYSMASQPAAILTPTLFDLREKELFKFATDDFERAEITGAGRSPLTIVRSTGTDNSVSYTVNGKAGDQAFVEDYIEDLSMVAAQEFPEASTDFGFSSPQLKVVVKLKAAPGAQPHELTLIVGSKLPEKKDGKDSYYAGVGDLSEPFVITEESLKQITPKEEGLLPVAAAPTAAAASAEPAKNP